jgi:Ca2+-binding RTX toxin-like protein
MIINIASAKELAHALSRADGGETFLLAPGDYGAVKLDELEFDRTVTIRSADPLNMARLTGLDIRGSENIRIVGLSIGRAMTPREQDHGRIVSVRDSEDIEFEGLRIHGSLDGDPRNDGYGIYVGDSERVSVRGSTFTELARGAVFSDSSNLVLEGNSFDTLRTDGLNFAEVTDVLIKDNRFTNFFPKRDDHSDAIQFFTHGTKRASFDITITGNQIFVGHGEGPQGIFLHDETRRMPFKNVTIDNNLVYGADLYHGIAVLGGEQVSITNNTVVSRTDDGRNHWINIDRVAGATISKNVADVVLIGERVSGIVRHDNLELYKNDDPRERILNLNKGPQTTVADLVLPGIGYVPDGSPSPEPAPPPSPAGIQTIMGTSGHDQLRGTAADEWLFGFAADDARLGRGSRDVMVGSGGKDVFVLGDARGVFYDDGRPGAGRRDYAAIRDFEAGDRIQLAGSATDYVLRTEHFGRKGIGLYLDSNSNGRWDKGDEFIAHISGPLLPKSLDADYFLFG